MVYFSDGTKLKAGSGVHEGNMGTFFYKKSPTSDNVDGGVSRTFPDVYYYNNKSTVKIRDSVANNALLFKNNLAFYPTYGDAELTGASLQLDVNSINPSDKTDISRKALIAFKLRDLPQQRGNLNLTDNTYGDSGNDIPTTPIFTDYLVYSSNHLNKVEEGPELDFQIDFSNLEVPKSQVVSRINSEVFYNEDPYISESDLMYAKDKNGDYAIFPGFSRTKVRRYLTDLTIDGTQVPGALNNQQLRLKDAGGIYSSGSGLAERYTPRDGRDLLTNEPTQKKSELEPYIKYQSQHIVAVTPESKQPYTISKNALIRSAFSTGVHSIAVGTTATASDATAAASSTDLAFSKMETGATYGKTGGSGLAMLSTWPAADGNSIRLESTSISNTTSNGSSTLDSAPIRQRMTNRITTEAVPIPVQTDSDLITSSAAAAHSDTYTWNGRVDIVFKVNKLPPPAMYHEDSLVTSNGPLIGLDRGLYFMWTETEPEKDDTVIHMMRDANHTIQDHTTAPHSTEMSTNKGFMGLGVFSNESDLVFVPNCRAPAGDGQGTDSQWDSNWGLDTHSKWYTDTVGASNDTDAVITCKTGLYDAGVRGVPKGVWLRLTYLFSLNHNHVTCVITDDSSGEQYGSFSIANGFNEANASDGDGLFSMWETNWARYFSIMTHNTKVDVNPVADPQTFTKTESGAGSVFGAPTLGEIANSEIDVHIDSITFSGFSGGAVNASTKSGNAYNKGNIDITTKNVKREPFASFASFNSAPEDTYHPNRNTIVIGHPTYPAALGANNVGDNNTFENDEQTYIVFNDYNQTNGFNAAIDIDPSQTMDLGDGANTKKFAMGFSSDEYQGKQMHLIRLVTKQIANNANTGYAMTGDGMNEGFSMKGAMSLDWADGSETFTAREHIMASARILKMVDNNSFIVDKPSLLMVDDDVPNSGFTFRIYKYNVASSSGNYEDVKIIDIDPNTRIVEVDTDLQGKINTTGAATDTTNSCFWMISPKCYWITMHFLNADASDNLLAAKSYSSLFGFVGDEDGSNPFNSLGFTFNESLYSDTFYEQNPFFLDTSLADGSSLSLNQDYGYGTVDDTKGKINSYGGYAGQLPITTTGRKYMNIDGAVTADSMNVGDPLGLFIDSANQGQYATEVEIKTGSHGNEPITLLTQFFDKKPEINDFKATPNKDNPQFTDFEWSLDGEDLWYGLLFVDSEVISSQYHNALVHIPLNEDNKDAMFAYFPVQGGHYTDGSNAAIKRESTETDFTTANLSPDGLAGFAKSFDSSDDAITFASSSPDTDFASEHEMTFVAHLIPDLVTSNDTRVFFEKSGVLKMSLESASAGTFVQAVITNRAGTSYTLKSGFVHTDGETPLSVIAVYDATLPNDNFKLYVNADMADSINTLTSADSDTNSKVATNTNSVFVGNDADGGNGLSGMLEEIVLYKQAVQVVNPQNTTFTFTKPLVDGEISRDSGGVNGAPQNYSARLFIKDYHNIRGYTSREVASSNPLQIRRTAFRLSRA